jgi:hypothetical protein
MSESTHPESMPLGLSFYSSEDQVALELASIVKFMRKDPDNLVFRRFERLNLYNLLLLQHRLAEYDEEISNLEKEWNGPALAEAIAKLEPLMKSYSEANDPSRLFPNLTSFRRGFSSSRADEESSIDTRACDLGSEGTRKGLS